MKISLRAEKKKKNIRRTEKNIRTTAQSSALTHGRFHFLFHRPNFGRYGRTGASTEKRKGTRSPKPRHQDSSTTSAPSEKPPLSPPSTAALQTVGKASSLKPRHPARDIRKSGMTFRSTKLHPAWFPEICKQHSKNSRKTSKLRNRP